MPATRRLILLAGAMALTPLQAKPGLYLNLWKPLSPAEPVEVVTVAKGEPVFEQTLHASGLRMLEQAAIDAVNGATVLPAGAQLFELAGEQGRAWCDITPPGGPIDPKDPPVRPDRYILGFTTLKTKDEQP